jgi:beta-galactosidase
VFWSMELNSFDEVSLPNLTVTEANPAARLDFWRFQSDQVAAYDKMQCDIIRKHSPGRFITHNFMGFFNEFDHWKLGENLDLASWDSYPVGFTEQFPFSEEDHVTWAETAHPDIAAFHHDLYRGVGRGRFWVMEQMPGPVNWAPWNPVPKPGMIRLWTWEALAHGAEVVSYFRWRQAPFAQEQNHAGLNMAGLSELSVGGREATQVGVELKKLGELPKSQQAPVAIVYDYEASWITRIQPQGQDFVYHELVFRWYEAVRRLGLDVDFVPPAHDLNGYKLVLVPSLPHVSDAALKAFENTDGVVLYGPRTGSKTRNFAIPEGLAPGPLRELLRIRITQVSSLRPGVIESVKGKVAGKAERWREYLENKAEVLARFANKDAALIANGNHHYLACWPDEKLLHATILLLSKKAKLKTLALPPHIRVRQRGDYSFAFNYGTKNWTLPTKAKPVLGKKTLEPQSVAIWRS